jgi:hypothetical protein
MIATGQTIGVGVGYQLQCRKMLCNTYSTSIEVEERRSGGYQKIAMSLMRKK